MASESARETSSPRAAGQQVIDNTEPAEVLGGTPTSIRDLLRKHFPPKEPPPKPDFPRPLWTGVVDFPTY